MPTRHVTDEQAALVALLRERPMKMSWSQIAEEVLERGSATALWDEIGLPQTLPGLKSPLDESRNLIEGWLGRDIQFVTILDEKYPSRLRDIVQAPPLLFYSGALRAADDGMSVVGSRSASPRGVSVAGNTARLLVERGLTVISGLASGVDTAAHRAALEAGGRTVAVIGTGITRSYPATNKELQRRIAVGGLVVSQFLPDAPPSKHSFPMRNVVMSGYGMATIIIEAGEHSGARIQARTAVEHGRPVILTDAVVATTGWGQKLVGQPGVHVAHGFGELEQIVDSVVTRERGLDRLLEDVVVTARQ